MAKHYLPNEYPEYKHNFVDVNVYLKNGKRTKAIFYRNGEKPKFVSGGAPITNLVVSWEYINEKEESQ